MSFMLELEGIMCMILVYPHLNPMITMVNGAELWVGIRLGRIATMKKQVIH